MASVLRLSAFTRGAEGGNPAGVQICPHGLPTSDAMVRLAKEIGCPATAFLHKQGDVWEVRYAAPGAEVAFCGHATLAAGGALGSVAGFGKHVLVTGSGEKLDVTVGTLGDLSCVGVSTPACHHTHARAEYVEQLFSCTSIEGADLDPDFLPVSNVTTGGSGTTFFVLKTREALEQATYDYDCLKAATAAAGIVTLCLAWRNPDGGADEYCVRVFGPAAGVREDPATGSAATGLFHYLRSVRTGAPPAVLCIKQGDYMTPEPFPSDLRVAIDPSGTVTLQGTVRSIVRAQ